MKTLFEPRGIYKFPQLNKPWCFKTEKNKPKNPNTGWSCAIQSTECLLKDLER